MMTPLDVQELINVMNAAELKRQQSPLRDARETLLVLQSRLESAVKITNHMQGHYAANGNRCAAYECEWAEQRYREALNDVAEIQKKLSVTLAR